MRRRVVVPVALALAIITSAILIGTDPLRSLSPGAQPRYVAAAPLSDPTWISGIQVQNLDSSNIANITITYYNRDGTVNATQSDTVGAGASKTYFATSMGASEGFAGSAVVSSDRQIAAIVNELTSGPTMGASYNGASAVATRLSLPLIMRGNSGWNTTIYVQNAGSSDVSNVALQFRGTTNYDYSISTIKAGSSAVVPQETMTSLGSRWVGSVTISSTQPVASTVNESNGTTLLSYTGFTSGGSKVYAPLLMSDNSGWWTGFQVMNIGSSAATVNLKINGSQTDQAVIQPGASKTWFPIPGMTSRVAAGVAEGASGTEQLVGVVNEVGPNGQGMSYDGFTSGTSKVFAPLLMNNNAGWYTGFQVMNIGTSAATVNLKINGSQVDQVVIQPGTSKTWFPIPGMTTAVAYGLAQGATGSEQLVGIVNEIKSGSGDNAMSYEAINQ